MPIVTVSMYTGRTQRDKDRLGEVITEDSGKHTKSGEKRCCNSVSISFPWKLVCF